VATRAAAVLFAQRGPFTHDEGQRRDAMKKEPIDDLRLLFLRLIAEETPDVATIVSFRQQRMIFLEQSCCTVAESL
jgi:hypothetical protein